MQRSSVVFWNSVGAKEENGGGADRERGEEGEEEEKSARERSYS